MVKEFTKIVTIGLMVVVSASLTVLAIAAQDKGKSTISKNQCSERAIYFLGFWGFGDFQGQPLRPKDKGKVLHLQNITPRNWSGWSKQWKGRLALSLKGHTTLVVQAEGVEESLQYKVPKLMKWFVQWPGQTSDVTVFAVDEDQIAADDPEWVVPIDGRFEYYLPTEAIKLGKLTKIGLTIFKGNTYGYVRLKAWLGCGTQMKE